MKIKMSTWYNLKMNYNDEIFYTYLIFFQLSDCYLQIMIDPQHPQYINWGLENQAMINKLEYYADTDEDREMIKKVYDTNSEDLRDIFKYIFTSLKSIRYENEYNRGNSSGQWEIRRDD